MSRDDVSCTGVCKKRFKGIENFLRRVAFNLGNTPSQTEVKIISCIPIDVTDLQQKIIHLEKELEDATNALQSQPPDNLPGKICKPNKYPRNSKSGCHRAIVESNFSNTTCEAVPCPCKSSESHKLCSPPACLENRGKSNVSFGILSNTNTTPIKRSSDNLNNTEGADQAYANMDRYYNQPVRSNNMDPFFNQAIKSNNMNRYYDQAMNPNNVNRYYDQVSDPNKMAHYYTTLPKMCEPQPNNQRHNIFKKKKKILKNKKNTSPCVYYAQTFSSPFIKSDLKEEAPIYDSNDIMNRSYLAAMVSKQYKPEVLGDNVSQRSQFSSPICRDVQPQARMPCEGACHFESDICSCCHGKFHNIDAHGNKQATLQTYMLQEMNAGSAFYDTNQYDLVPVKEKPVKIKKEPRANIDMKCWPENVRTKYRYHALNPVPPSTHYSARPRDDYTLRDKLDSYSRIMPVTYNRVEPIKKISAKRRKETYRRERSINVETSRSCCIDFGNVYPRKSCKKPRRLDSIQHLPRQQVPMKNAECLTTAINNSECQTELNTFEVTVNDNKTEATLNQIKSILQSVLAEVKVSGQTKGSPTIEKKPKKDAVVQKGASCNNMEASSFMNSITYSPYAMNPSPYVTSCSRQMNPSQFYCQHGNGGMKCFHNFPVFIQNPGGRHVCSNCYRSSQAKPGCMKQATTTATNTDVVQEKHSQETEKLIKEIYKSMALTVDFPNNTSLSEYDETMKSLHCFTSPDVLKTEPKKQQPKIIRNVVQAVSELFMKKDMVDTSETFNTTIDSKVPSHQTSMRSHVVNSTDTELRARKERLAQYMRAKNRQPVLHEVDKKSYREVMVQNANSYSESELSSSEGDTVTTVVAQAQQTSPEHKHVFIKGKQGLLSKMFKSVKLFKPKEKPKKKVEKERMESEEETTSDSDDYQTVYSQKIEKNQRHRSRPHYLPKRKTHSKISYKQAFQRDRSPEKKKSPYMEQEYRRYWDEKLMFQNKRPRHSERQHSDQSTPRRSAYYQSYEARPVLVEPNTYVPKNKPEMTEGNDNVNRSILKPASKGMAWLKKHKMGIHCGEQWKKFVLES